MDLIFETKDQNYTTMYMIVLRFYKKKIRYANFNGLQIKAQPFLIS